MRERVIEELKKVISEGAEIEVTAPDLERQGHYSTNVAFRLAKTSDQRPTTNEQQPANNEQRLKIYNTTNVSPHEVAENIVQKLRESGADLFEKIEVAGGGFINFWLKSEILQNELLEILRLKKKYGSQKSRVDGQKSKVQVEYVSANPTGPLTLANGRGGFLGDVLANVLERIGYKVEREYYINDVGNQILILGKSILAAIGVIADAEEFYKGDYVKEWAEKNNKIVLRRKDEPMKIGQMAAKYFLKSIKDVLAKKAGIEFDKWTSEEKDIHKKKLAEKALDVFKKKSFVYEKDGAVWLKTTEFGDDKDRVLITSAGAPTYFLADGGHYLETWERGFKRKINILGPDNYGYVKRIQAVAKILGFEKSDVIITQALRLVEGGKEVKISKRKGQFITFEELVDEVGIDAARFFFLMVSYDSHMDFDMALAKEKSNKNPVYYTQYAFVRAQSILRKIKNKKLKIKMTIQNLKLLDTNEDIKLILKLAQFLEVIEDTAKDYQVHRLTRYATELARAFHNFYEEERILGEEKNIAAARLVLVQATEIVFKNLFGILGISAPEKM